MQTTELQKLLPELAKAIAKAMPGWKVSPKENANDADWRTYLDGPNIGEQLFLSNSWGAKGMLHIRGNVPEGVSHNVITIPAMPTINTNLNKSPEQMAKDIERRLLPEYRKVLAEVMAKWAEHLAWAAKKEETKKAVLKIIKGSTSYHRPDYVYSPGSISVQVNGPDSISIDRHLYLTVDQLKRFHAAVPELFERSES